MKNFKIPDVVLNFINGKEENSKAGEYFAKLNPHNGEKICDAARSKGDDVNNAVNFAKNAREGWANINPVKRGEILFDIINKMKECKADIAEIVSLETGKSYNDAIGETNGAIACGNFFAAEGQRLYAKTCTSGVNNKFAMTVREPVGVAGLIVPANTPIANIAWKVFPALICGNTVVLKASEDAPLTAWIIGNMFNNTGLPDGVFNIIHGIGEEAGSPLVENKDVDLLSFTGSTRVGRYIAKVAGERLTKVSLELGGKNPLIVCDDADLDNACKWVLLSAFSNAGQRCAAGSRIIIFESIYEKFKEMLLEKTKQLKIGPGNNDDFGPVINERQLNNMLGSIKKAEKNGAKILTGGFRIIDEFHKNGFYMSPTIIENVKPEDEISKIELFGPITSLYRVGDFKEAIDIANDSPYGLTACIHTKNFSRAIEFTRKIQAGVAIVNGGTYGSEPHMPFGGVKQSGNGTREPGIEALDIYSNLKDIYQFINNNEF